MIPGVRNFSEICELAAILQTYGMIKNSRKKYANWHKYFANNYFLRELYVPCGLL